MPPPERDPARNFSVASTVKLPKSWGSPMQTRLGIMVFAALLTTPVAAQGLVGGAERGADEGGAAAGPVGAIVGGAVGAATGTVGGILGIGERPRFRTYVEEEHVHSYDYDRPLRAGTVLPDDYDFHDVPESYHVRRDYRYTVINHHPVIVDPVTRRVVEVIE